jgi:dihydrofolate reductase
MRKVIAALNITIDGFCDHTAGVPDKEIHQHYTDLLNDGDVILYGRTTYELMEYWRPMVKKPSGEKTMDDFAVAIDKIEKIVFSRSLKTVDWESAKLSEQTPEEELNRLKKLPGKNIYVGSRSLIIQLLNLNLIDELQLCVHPVVIGQGLPLFDKIEEQRTFKLLRTRTFKAGAMLMCYDPGSAK